MKIIKLLSLSLLLFLVQGCKKYLEEKSDKSLVVIKSLADLQGLLDNKTIMNLNTPGFGETSNDDYFVTLNAYNSFGDIDKRAYSWRLENYNFQNDWGLTYNAVYNANYCIEHVGDIERNARNATDWDNIIGSAYFYRGFCFLNLAWEYAKAYDEDSADVDLGIVLRMGTDFNIPSVRANVRQTYEQIIYDLKESVKYLADNPTHPMRPSKAASYAAIARAYLSMRKYDSTFKYANLSLNIKSDLLDYNSGEVNPTSNVPFKPFNQEIIFYTTESGNYTPKFSFYALADSNLYSQYNDNDLRKKVFYYSNGGYKSFKGSYGSGMYIFFSGIATDEMYLTRAEALARLGKFTEGMNELNTLLSKRFKIGMFVPLAASNSEEAINIILTERRKELTMRGLRWIDIKRLNKEGRNIILKRIIGNESYSLLPNDKRYALPLPQDIIDITGIQQN